MLKLIATVTCAYITAKNTVIYFVHECVIYLLFILCTEMHSRDRKKGKKHQCHQVPLNLLYLHTQISLSLSLLLSLSVPLHLSLHTPLSVSPSLFPSREAWPHLGAMITHGRVINGCRVRREISNGQAVSWRKCSGVFWLPQGPVKVSLADFTQAWPFSWGSWDNWVYANQLTKLNPKIHKHHSKKERFPRIKQFHAGQTQAHPFIWLSSQILYVSGAYTNTVHNL